MNPLEIIVRGHARQRYPAERASVGLSATLEGGEREDVYRRAVALAEPLGEDLRRCQDAGAVTRWSSDQLRVYSYRPYSETKTRRLRYRVAIKFDAEFTDFEQLSAFLDRWAVSDGVEVGYTRWDVTEDNRRQYEAQLRRDAVGDATAKAQAYADAAGRGKVVAVQLSDPDMLDTGHRAGPRVMAMAALADSAGAPELDLQPDDIELSVSVDARFLAE
ncbi:MULTISPECIES: SIMPL domain-containing protein [Mycolicibacterium]|uniref:Predicted periplasmic/secreted protein n=1 Tax=Mycolicibacterium chitae TaxID=1792 RepID=A0A448I4I7_MYCCI|nr:SIMPL domain-containing protein [Mycolicibacterium chitae]MCV7107966.1 SIMPL domain-containing protein [Mycolicibacterium chitae]VEG47398.1 Predicted periplasmic/secreted protein [Mycolicibacterium chitae]